MRYFLLLICVACTVPQMPEPARPVALHSAHAASDVAQIAAQQLTSAGFTVTQSDATNGIVTAHRDRMKDGNSDFANCKFPAGSSGANLMQTDMTVSVIAKAAASGSDVQITGSVRTTYPGVELLRPSDEDCASNGVIEKRIADAIR